MEGRKKWEGPGSSWLWAMVFFTMVRQGRFPLRGAISEPAQAVRGRSAKNVQGHLTRAAQGLSRAGAFLVAMASAYFAEARVGANAMMMTMAASVIGYGGYLIRIDSWPGEFEKPLLIAFVAMIPVVWLWNWAAAALWRWRPEWRQKIRRKGYKIPRIMLLLVVVTAVAFVGGWNGFVLTFFFALLMGVLPLVCGVVAWPIIAFCIWLPRRRNWKFSELFCATIRSCDAAM